MLEVLRLISYALCKILKKVLLHLLLLNGKQDQAQIEVIGHPARREDPAKLPLNRLRLPKPNELGHD
jgi:hypothetical protein